MIAPMINSVEDARRFADFMKFPPLGRRSWGPRAALALTGLVGPAYMHGANAGLAEMFQRVLDGLALRIKNRFFRRDDNFCFHNVAK